MLFEAECMPDDILYLIFEYLSTCDLVAFLSTHKKQFINQFTDSTKSFWLRYFDSLPLPNKYRYVIDTRDHFKILKCHHRLQQLDDQLMMVKQLKIIKYMTFTITCPITKHRHMEKYIRRLFPNFSLPLLRLELIEFFYNGYIWIYTYEAATDTQGVYVVHEVDLNDEHPIHCGPQSMLLFLYKMLTLNLTFTIRY